MLLKPFDHTDFISLSSKFHSQNAYWAKLHWWPNPLVSQLDWLLDPCRFRQPAVRDPHSECVKWGWQAFTTHKHVSILKFEYLITRDSHIRAYVCPKFSIFPQVYFDMEGISWHSHVVQHAQIFSIFHDTSAIKKNIYEECTSLPS